MFNSKQYAKFIARIFLMDVNLEQNYLYTSEQIATNEKEDDEKKELNLLSHDWIDGYGHGSTKLKVYLIVYVICTFSIQPNLFCCCCSFIVYKNSIFNSHLNWFLADKVLQIVANEFFHIFERRKKL